MEDSDRPLILLDVDGVLNTWYPHDGLTVAEVDYHGSPTIVCIDRGLGRQLLDLAQETGAELAWATMWEEWANISIGPLLGLPELPVAPAVPENVDNLPWFEGGLGVYKAGLVVPWTNGRPFVWFDDELGTISQMTLLAQGQQHLPVHVDDRYGLTAADISAARLWLLALGKRRAHSRSQ